MSGIVGWSLAMPPDWTTPVMLATTLNRLFPKVCFRDAYAIFDWSSCNVLALHDGSIQNDAAVLQRSSLETVHCKGIFLQNRIHL